MARNFYPLISHLILEVSKLTAVGNVRSQSLRYRGNETKQDQLRRLAGARGAGKHALQYYAEWGKVPTDKLDEMVTQAGMLENLGIISPGAPLSCGITANAFCHIFLGKPIPSTQCSLEEMMKKVKDRKQRLIRVQLPGHVFVIEQLETIRGWGVPQGNVYQSNIAVLGSSDTIGITLKQYLEEHKNPVRLSEYLAALALLSSEKTDPGERVKTYKELFTTQSYLKDKRLKDIEKKLFEAKSKPAGKAKLYYESFDERHVLKVVNMILTAYGNLSGAAEARDIYFSRCWV